MSQNIEHLHPPDKAIYRDCAAAGCPEIVIDVAGAVCDDCETNECGDVCTCEQEDSNRPVARAADDSADRREVLQTLQAEGFLEIWS